MSKTRTNRKYRDWWTEMRTPTYTPSTTPPAPLSNVSSTPNVHTPVTTYTRCDHEDWLECGPHTLFLKSSLGDVDNRVQVYIDLTGHDNIPVVPRALEHLLPPNATHYVSWPVTDGHIDDTLVEFAANVLRAGMVLGFGCVGGHGRTGWLATRLVLLFTALTPDDALTYVRTNYCERAVETYAQLNNIGATKHEPPPPRWSASAYDYTKPAGTLPVNAPALLDAWDEYDVYEDDFVGVLTDDTAPGTTAHECAYNIPYGDEED